MSEDKVKEDFYKIIYDLEIDLKGKKNELGERSFSDEYIETIINNLKKIFEEKKLKLVKKN